MVALNEELSGIAEEPQARSGCGAAEGAMTFPPKNQSNPRSVPYCSDSYLPDSDSSRHYARNRNYSPSIGRFTSQDPLQFINGANTSRFVMSNPVGHVDPWGLELASMSGPWGHPPGQGNGPDPIAQAAGYLWNELNRFSNWLNPYLNNPGVQHALSVAVPAAGAEEGGARAVGDGLNALRDDKPPEPKPETKGPARKAYPKAAKNAGAIPADAQRALDEIDQGAARPNVRRPQAFANEGARRISLSAANGCCWESNYIYRAYCKSTSARWCIGCTTYCHGK